MNAWDGGPNNLNGSLDEEKRNIYNSNDDYDEDFDRGKVSHSMHSITNSGFNFFSLIFFRLKKLNLIELNTQVLIQITIHFKSLK